MDTNLNKTNMQTLMIARRNVVFRNILKFLYIGQKYCYSKIGRLMNKGGEKVFKKGSNYI
jgi:hypothetical protein